MIRSLCLAALLAAAFCRPALAEAAEALEVIRAWQLYLDGQPGLAFATVWRLAQAGDPQAEVTLGFFYARGIGTVGDPARAVALFESAAARNHPVALFNLAVSYEHGSLGLPRDPAQALALYLRSAALDHAPSLHRLGLLYLSAERSPSSMSARDFPQDAELGRALLERAVAAGHPQATADLARLLLTGRGMSMDLPRARQLYLIAAAHGIGEAQRDYSLMLEKGSGGPADLTQAEFWFRRAQASGINEAGRDLSRILSRNKVPGSDRHLEALAWCLWYEATLPTFIPEDPLRHCTWARTGLGPDEVAAAQALAQTF